MAQFKVGQHVKAVAFVDCFGAQQPETVGLTVASIVKIVTPSMHLPDYYRLTVVDASGFTRFEGAERFFAAN